MGAFTWRLGAARSFLGDFVMSITTYRLIFRGEVTQGQSVDAVKQRVAQLFKLPAETAAQLFSGTEMVLKKSTDETSLKKLQQTMMQLGAITHLEGELDLPLDPSPVCAPVSAQAQPVAAPPAGSAVSADVPAQGRRAADYAVLLLAIPVIGTLLIWLWVGSMNLLQSPGSSLTLIMVAAIVGTATLAAMEAAKVGMVYDRRNGTYGPAQWFLLVALLWIVGYPAYLFKRRHYALKNHLISGMAVAVLFVGSSVIMSAAIERKQAEIGASLRDLGNGFNFSERNVGQRSARVAAPAPMPPTARGSADPELVSDNVVRAQVAEGIASIVPVKEAVAEYFAINGAWPPNDAALGVKVSTTNPYVSSVTTTNGVITITYGDRADSRISGRVLTIAPAVNPDSGDIAYACGNAAAPAGFTPAGQGMTSLPGTYLPRICGGSDAEVRNTAAPPTVAAVPSESAGANRSVLVPREQFRALLMTKTREEVLAAAGRPDNTGDYAGLTVWVYERRTTDPVTNSIDSIAQVIFDNGHVSQVNFN